MTFKIRKPVKDRNRKNLNLQAGKQIKSSLIFFYLWNL